MWRNMTRAWAVVACAALLTGTGAAAQATTGRAPDALSRPHVFGWGFNGPDSIATDGSDVWAVNYHGDSVTEMDAATGTQGRVLIGKLYGLHNPDAIASGGSHVWVTNTGGGSVTELDAATGALVQVISGPSYGFQDPDAIASDGTHCGSPTRVVR